MAVEWLLADVRLHGLLFIDTDEIAIYLHRDGPLAVFPIPGGRARLIADVGKMDPNHPRPDPTLADCQAMVDQRAGGAMSLIRSGSRIFASMSGRCPSTGMAAFS